jgi:hypothetical protein
VKIIKDKRGDIKDSGNFRRKYDLIFKGRKSKTSQELMVVLCSEGNVKPIINTTT